MTLLCPPRRWTTRLAFGALITMATACSSDTPSASMPLEPAFARGGGSTTSSIVVTVSGLPAGTNAGIVVTGGGGYRTTVNSSTTLTGLSNGSYTLTAGAVAASGTTYQPTPTSQSVSVSKGSTGRASISYAPQPTTGSLAVTISVPDGSAGAVTVTGPNAYSTALTTSSTLSSLAPGTYTITAAGVTSGGVIYSPTTATQTASVTAGVTTASSVSYTASGVVPSPDFNMQILGMYLVQSVQDMNSGVTLIAGRPAVLRVFPVANGANSVKPAVRVKLYINGALQSTLTATSTGTSVPTALSEASAASSWNFSIPGALVQPGLSVLAELDPDNTVAESNESDNVFPSTGTPKGMIVRGVPTEYVTFVPVLQSSTGGTGNIVDTNAEAFLQSTRDILPVNDVQYTFHAPYSTSNTLLSDGTGWSATLSEVYSLRSVEKSSAHYYGVVKVPYGSGVAGMGYIGAPASIGWDYLPSGSTTMAHEFGHNWGRQHAPCGGVAGPDPSFPYAGGIDGVFGWSVRTNTLVASSTADLMGYCSPRWISDYNYKAMMTFRGFTTAAFTASAVDQEGLLIWGRVDAQGAIILEPAVAVNAPATVLPATGSYTLSATDAAGDTLVSFAFDPMAVADGADGEGHFAFVVPMNTATQARLSTLGVTGKGKGAERRATQSANGLATAAAASNAAAENVERVRLRWDAQTFPMVLVRNAASGEVLSFARGGDAAITTSATDLEVVYSDGVRSAGGRVRVRGR